MYSAITKNKINTIVIIAIFIVLIAAIGYGFSWLYGDWTITIWVTVFATIYALIQYFAAGSLAVAVSGARQIGPDDDKRLYRIVENLAITTGTPMPKVYIMDDPAPNAFATGRKPEEGIVCATTGLLAIMDDRELEAVMAHEMGHIRNYDIRVTMIVFGLSVAIGMIADILFRMSLFGGGRRNSNENGNAAIIMLIMSLVAIIIVPVVSALIRMAVSRQREYAADATGALTTRDSDGLISALQKLEDYGRPMRKQNSSMAPMYISDPSKPGMMDRLFATHPPIPDRIERLRKNATKF